MKTGKTKRRAIQVMVCAIVMMMGWTGTGMNASAAKKVTAQNQGKTAPLIKLNKTYKVTTKKSSGLLKFRAPETAIYKVTLSGLSSKKIKKSEDTYRISALIIDKENAQRTTKSKNKTLYYLPWDYLQKIVEDDWEDTDALVIATNQYRKTMSKKSPSKNYGEIVLTKGQLYMFATIGGNSDGYSYTLRITKE